MEIFNEQPPRNPFSLEASLGCQRLHLERSVPWPGVGFLLADMVGNLWASFFPSHSGPSQTHSSAWGPQCCAYNLTSSPPLIPPIYILPILETQLKFHVLEALNHFLVQRLPLSAACH